MMRSIILAPLPVLLTLWSCISVTVAQEQPDANALMVSSHEARASWNGFPGFTADVVVSEDGKRASGSVTVDASGELSLELSDSFEWAKSKLASLVAHRMGDENREYDVSFVDDQKSHPLGRLIRINDDALMGSQYRIQNDIIREVHRTMQGTQFTITVMDVARNPDGQYLPKFYTVSFWDEKTGKLKSTTVIRDDWARVGKWDLPKRLLAIESANDGRRSVKQIRVKNHRLMDDAE